MTPERDAMVRNQAQKAYEFATAELARFDCPEGVNFMAWMDAPFCTQNAEYRQWLYSLKAFANYRRRHPIVRLLQQSQNLGRVERNEYGEPGARFHWHWQNLDGDQRKPDASPSWGTLGLPDLGHEGRAWITWQPVDGQKPVRLDLDWLFGRRVWSSGVSVGRSEGGSVTLHAAIRPLFSLYATLKHILPRGASRTYSVAIVADGPTLHWDLGKPGSGDEWHRDDPLNWMRGVRFLADDLFGRATCTTEKNGPPVQAVACFPEGRYTLTLQRETWTWTRPRWPWPYVRRSVNIELEQPPEFHGKGENSYDCGPDAIYGMSSTGHRYEDAVAAYVTAVLRERAKRGHLSPEHRTVLTEAVS